MSADKQFNDFEKKEAVRVKNEILKTIEDVRIAKYV